MLQLQECGRPLKYDNSSSSLGALPFWPRRAATLADDDAGSQRLMPRRSLWSGGGRRVELGELLSDTIELVEESVDRACDCHLVER